MTGLESKRIRCYAEGRRGHWEAYCLDFDLAVQGDNFRDVLDKLDNQIRLYVEGVMSLPPSERERLLNRRAPFGSWFRVSVHTLLASLMRNRGRDGRACFNFPLDDCRAAA